MKFLTITLLSALLGQTAFGMACDTGWICTSASGKYSVSVARCRYSNDIHNLETVTIGGKDVTSQSKITASYDSESIGGHLLAIELSVPAPAGNDAHYLSIETTDLKGTITERLQPSNPGLQNAVGSEAITCTEEE